jgi:hypothetical protein
MNLTKIMDALKELSNIDYQRRVWMGLGNREVSSIEEAGCRLFVDSGLGHALSMGTVYSEQIDEALKRLRDDVEALYMKVNTLADVEAATMQHVRSESHSILSAIKTETLR